jgi:hypothetical protein
MGCGTHFMHSNNCMACISEEQGSATRRTIEDQAHKTRMANTPAGNGWLDMGFSILLFACFASIIGFLVSLFVVPLVLAAEAILLVLGKWKPEEVALNWRRGRRARTALDRFAIWSLPIGGCAIAATSMHGSRDTYWWAVGFGLVGGALFILATWRWNRFMKSTR